MRRITSARNAGPPVSVIFVICQQDVASRLRIVVPALSPFPAFINEAQQAAEAAEAAGGA